VQLQDFANHHSARAHTHTHKLHTWAEINHDLQTRIMHGQKKQQLVLIFFSCTLV
jgi:hypothetical protein